MEDSRDRRPLVLLTGAEGTIGGGFRDEYSGSYEDSYRLRLAVRDPEFRDDRFDPPTLVDLEDLERVREACRGVHTVVHLAANAEWKAPFEELLGPNVVGAYNLFEAARQMGCKRVVYASSVHAIMGYPVDRQVHEHDPPRADSLYGATKVFGEALCSAYSHQYGLSCIAVRIGAYVGGGPRGGVVRSGNPQFLDIFVSQRDLCQLIHRCILAPPELTYAVVSGLSDNRFKRIDIHQARTLLGYQPKDDAFALSEAVHLGRDRKV